MRRALRDRSWTGEARLARGKGEARAEGEGGAPAVRQVVVGRLHEPRLGLVEVDEATVPAGARELHAARLARAVGLTLVARDKDGLGLDGAVDDVVRVQVLDGGDELGKVGESAIGSKLADGREEALERGRADGRCGDEDGPALAGADRALSLRVGREEGWRVADDAVGRDREDVRVLERVDAVEVGLDLAELALACP